MFHRPALSAWPALGAVCASLLVFSACEKGSEKSPQTDSKRAASDSADPESDDPSDTSKPPEVDPLAAEFPLYGLVTGTQLTIHEEPDPESLVMGWLRHGEIIRLKPGVTKTSTCNTGWYALHPVGHACAGVGIEISETPIEVAPELRAQAQREQALPYDYYFVKDYKVPEYFQLPSRSQQRLAATYAARWNELAADEKKARVLARFLEGKLQGEPTSPAGVRRYLDRGFFVAGTGIEVRAQRRFVRTVRGTYVQEAQLLRKDSPTFQGVELGEELQLPIAWAVRTSRPLEPLHKWDGEIKWRERQDLEPIERLSRLPQWQGTKNIGGRQMHELEGEVYLRDWFVAVAEVVDPPRGVDPDEPWVHVDLGEQTLVLYRGKRPVYATLISSGLPEHSTPTGEFQVMRKHVSDTMSDIGADAADDRYSIEDVPWTQYFSGSLALHGAFWHERFGMRRSHGCVNISPPDAQRVFHHTWPRVPAGWHGTSVFKTGFKSSRVLVTE